MIKVLQTHVTKFATSSGVANRFSRQLGLTEELLLDFASAGPLHGGKLLHEFPTPSETVKTVFTVTLVSTVVFGETVLITP